jgi:hypothetical protein
LLRGDILFSLIIIILIVITFFCIHSIQNANRSKYYIQKSKVLTDFRILEKAIFDFNKYYGYMPLVNKKDDLQEYGLIEVLVGRKFLDGSPASNDVRRLNPDIIIFSQM